MTAVTRLWQTDRPLVATGLVALALVPVSLAGLVLDPRVITGAPAWLKPLKFAMSIAVYTFTLAWVFTYLPDWRRTRRVVGRVTAAALILELILIDGQAMRGTTSHFNTATTFDLVVFSVMGLVITTQTVVSIAVAVALWRQRFEDAALGWALRLGMLLTIVGASTGGLMTQPTASQIAEARATHHLPISGAHTVGAPDGGPGLPLTGWSTSHGDIRVPHFIGLHALQALPLLLLIALPRRRFSDTRRVQLTILAAAGYAGLFLLLLAQALAGRPVWPT
jgi:hypothetical protein